MESINNIIFSSKVRLQTGFTRLIGKNGVLTLTGDNQLIFKGTGAKRDKDFALTLSDIGMADFRNANAGRVNIYTKSRVIYRLIFRKKRLQSTFSSSKSGTETKDDSKVRPAYEWENHLKSMIDPRIVLGSDKQS